MTTLNIKGMTCSHCAENVSKSLSSVPGVVSVEVDLNGGKAVVAGKDLDSEALRKAVEDLGYTVLSIEVGQTGSDDNSEVKE